MKVIIAITIVGFAALAYASILPDMEFLAMENFDKPTCPPNPSGKEILLPNPANCTTYYHCNGGYAWEMPCPEGLHWNAKLELCDYPQTACCDSEYDPENKCEENQ